MSGISGSIPGVEGGNVSAPRRMRITNMSALSQGLDTEKLVNANLSAAAIPLEQMQQHQADLDAKSAIWRQVQQKLDGFLKAAGNLHLRQDFSAFKSIVPPHSPFTVTPGPGSSLGTYSVSVTSLARPGVLVSSGVADKDKTSVLNIPPDGAFSHATLTFLIGDHLVGGKIRSVRIDQSTGFTLESLAGAINDAHIGIHAMVMRTGAPGAPYSLSLSSTKNGMNFRVMEQEGLDFTFKTVQKASLARLTVNGVPVQSESNDVADAIPGSVIHLRQTTGATPTTVSIVHNTKTIKTNVGAFIKSYNSLLDFLDKETRVNPATGQGGPLLGAYSVVDLRNRLGTLLTRPLPEKVQGKFRTLGDVGITFQRNGHLSFDAGKFDKALASNYDDVVHLMTGQGTTPGIVAGIHDLLMEFANPASGPLASEISDINDQERTNVREMTRKQDELANLKDQLEEKYSGLQGLLGGLNQKQAYVQQQIARGVL
ncbi:MAG: flagellar filament capping protein FliD [Leptospirillia bacterium]